MSVTALPDSTFGQPCGLTDQTGGYSTTRCRGENSIFHYQVAIFNMCTDFTLPPGDGCSIEYPPRNFSLAVIQGGNSFALLGNGDVFVTGGKADQDQRLEPGVRTFIYSRESAEWRRCPDLPTPRFGFACGVCADPAAQSEEVWVIGGWFVSQYLDVVEVHCIREGSIITFNSARFHCSPNECLEDQAFANRDMISYKVKIVHNHLMPPSGKVYSVREGKWRAVAPFPMPVFEATVVPFGDAFLVIGKFQVASNCANINH